MFRSSITHRFFMIIIGLILLFALHLRADTMHSISVVYPGKNKTDRISSVERDGILYASLEDLASVADITYFHNPKNRKWVLRDGSQSIKVTALNPFVLVDDNAYQLPIPPIDINSRIYVPLIHFLQTIDTVLLVEFSFDRQQNLLKIKQSPNNITDVQVDNRANGTLIHILTAKSFKDSEISSSYSKGWLNITIYGGHLDTLQIASGQLPGIVNQIVSFQFDKSAQISIQLGQRIKDHKIYAKQNEVLVTLWSTEKLTDKSLKKANENHKRWMIDRIVIDPGHGGKHPGAVSKSGLKEKDVTLDIAKRLKRLLIKKSDIEVLMTRESDVYVDLKDRTQFANASNGKLFISIHADGNTNRKIRGFSTYILGVAKTEQAREVAQRENSVIELEDSQERYKEYQNASYIINAIAQSSYMKESENLANMVNKSLKKWTKNPNLGVHQAGFYVLIGAAMPSVLIETGFLSNAYEERLLKTRTFRQKLAEAMCESILKFKNEYEKDIG